MKILLTGVTGLIGRKFAITAFERGHRIVVLAREPSGIARRLGIPCETFQWDASSGAQIPAEAFSQVDAIVHLAGEPIASGHWTPQKKAAVLDSRVKGTLSLRDALLTLPERSRPKVWICASAIGIYGDRAEAVLNESCAPCLDESDFLAHVCREWEAATRDQHGPVPGVRTANLRFGIVLAPDGGALEVMALPFRLGIGGIIGNGKQWMSWVHVNDAVEAIVFALHNEKLEGPVNVTSPTPVTNEAFTRALSKALSVPALLRVPKAALVTVLREKSFMVLASQRVLPTKLLAEDFKFRHTKIETALTDLLKLERFETAQWIPRPRDEVFEFFSDAKNLERLTPPWLRFRLHGNGTEKIVKNSTLRYDLRVHGVRLRWESRIDRFEPNCLFRDVQIKGPYRRWEHTHEFVTSHNGTLVKDHVRYQVPLGALGRAVAGDWLKKDLAKIFEYRKDALRELFADP